MSQDHDVGKSARGVGESYGLAARGDAGRTRSVPRAPGLPLEVRADRRRPGHGDRVTGALGIVPRLLRRWSSSRGPALRQGSPPGRRSFRRESRPGSSKAPRRGRCRRSRDWPRWRASGSRRNPRHDPRALAADGTMARRNAKARDEPHGSCPDSRADARNE